MRTRSTQRKHSAVARASQSVGRSDYRAWSGGIAALLEEARRQSARSVNAILTATYWEIGRRIVEFVQRGETRAEYGDEVVRQLSRDLTKRFGRGFGYINLGMMRRFFLTWPSEAIVQTLSEQSRRRAGLPIVQTASEQFMAFQICQTPSGKFVPPISATSSRKSEIDLTLYLEALCHAFPLSWSHYVRLLSVESPEARAFYETESLRGGWSVRQLDRQGENPPVGLILCSEHDEAVARYSMGNLRNKILATQYKLNLPDPHTLELEIEKTRRLLESPTHRLRRK